MNAARWAMAAARRIVPTFLRRPLRWNRLFFSSFKTAFKSHPHRIIIDITSACDLACVDCNRSCGLNQAPSADHMDPGQVKRFVGESIRDGRLWYGEGEPLTPEQNGVRIEGGDPRHEGIRLEGGEPTQHPRLDSILAILLDYKRVSAPLTGIVICSNGVSEETRRVLASLPPGVRVRNSMKQEPANDLHCAFNMAPVDNPLFRGHDFSKGCWLPMYYGIGLTRHGYYPHPVCGAIDRVLGLDIGLKRLPPADHSWEEHYRRLCPYCGHYNRYTPGGPVRYAGRRTERGGMSPFWRKAYENYRKKKPELSLY